jgi:hypothetical protein
VESEYHGRTPNFGLRDFLFYLIPGGVILASLVILVYPEPDILENWTGLNAAIAGILLAYFFGQATYPLVYIIRPHTRRVSALRDFPNEDDTEFARQHFHLIEQHSVFYDTVVFRDRSLARFSLAMVFPTVLFTASILRVIYASSLCIVGAVVVIGGLAVYGFWLRHVHYERRYRMEVMRAKELLPRVHRWSREGSKI